MNVLIVDDDHYVTKAIEMKVNWDRLFVDEVHIANNTRQAKKLFSEYHIDILITDIEMPQESGLDLQLWVKENCFSTQTIFMTSYADFNYAKRALELESLEYFLKPVKYGELEIGILKAIEKVKILEKQEKYKKDSQLLKINKMKLISNFWRRYFYECDLTGEDLKYWLQKNNNFYETGDYFLPVIIELFDGIHTIHNWKKIELSRKLNSLINTVFSESTIEPQTLLNLSTKRWTLILKIEAPQKKCNLKDLCRNLINLINSEFNLTCNVYTGQSKVIFSLKKQLNELEKMSSNSIGEKGIVFEISKYKKRVVEYNLPSVKLWEKLIIDGKKDVLLQNIEHYLNRLVFKKSINRTVLKQIRMDVMQLVFYYLKDKDVSAHKLFATEENDELYKEAENSIEALILYFDYLIDRAIEFTNFTREPISVVERIKLYLDNNFQNDITRKDLSEIFYLNHDYISRIFSKECGISISGYLMEKRVEEACTLLKSESRRLTICEISNYVGYSNYSYFSKIFKERMGYSPKGYQKKLKDEK